VLTYNVLGVPTAAEVRVPALMSILEDSGSDVIALQEVAPWFVRTLRAARWTDGYHWSLPEGAERAPGGLLVLSRFPIDEVQRIPLPSRQRRLALAVRVRLGTHRMSIVTVHLDSHLESGSIRAEQLRRVFAFLADADEAIVLGDFNFGDDDERETAALDQRYVDLWTRLRPGEPGYTWNMEKSPMARRGSFPNEHSRRIDRILLRSTLFAPASAAILGDAPVGRGGEVFPSDHFGLTGTIAREPRER
jgi:endonuclease/exonuclease/phosphatase family metal-dependent hydrolase